MNDTFAALKRERTTSFDKLTKEVEKLSNNNQQDPVGEYNSKLWNSGNESDKDIVRKQKRRLTYISNIYIVSDPSNPQNEGKVFLYKYGKKIFDKINEQMNPTFQDETAVNPFDLWEGANFKMKIRHVEGYRNYDKSEFDAPSPLLEDDDEMEKVWNSQHSLAAFIAPDQFKSYDQLKARLDPAPVAEPTVGKSAKASWDDNEDDDNLAFFEKLAEDDE